MRSETNVPGCCLLATEDRHRVHLKDVTKVSTQSDERFLLNLDSEHGTMFVGWDRKELAGIVPQMEDALAAMKRHMAATAPEGPKVEAVGAEG